MNWKIRLTSLFKRALAWVTMLVALVGALTASPRAEALTPAETTAVITALNTILDGGMASGAQAAQLWDALAYYEGTAGTITETNIVLSTATEAELGLGASSTAYTMVQVSLYGLIIAEVAVLGYESYLWWYYNEEIEDGLEEYIDLGEEMGQTAEEAEVEYYEDLYEENEYWDNFCDMYWCF